MRHLALLVSLLPFVAPAAPKKENEEKPPLAVLYGDGNLRRTYVHCVFVERSDSYSFAPTDKIRCDFTQEGLFPPDATEIEESAAKGEFDSGARLRVSATTRGSLPPFVLVPRWFPVERAATTLRC
jgi:hypothetical protein